MKAPVHLKSRAIVIIASILTVGPTLSAQEMADSVHQTRANPVLAEAYSARFSAVNPALFGYTPNDVYICQPTKYNNGENVIKPDPEKYPWEASLGNGMPNVIVDEYGNVSVYLSSFLAFASKPPSRVGMVAYTNNTSSYTNWTRPNAGLYWYNPKGQTADEKISADSIAWSQSTNVVAIDIESVGMYDEYDVSKNGIKLIYLPQRESHNKILSAYEMNKSFRPNGLLSGFYDMKYNRTRLQSNFTFNFINGDTHMGWIRLNGIFSFVSRVNAKRSYIKPDEHLPFRPDHRKRYRRETVTVVGPSIVSQHVPLDVALDMSTPQWEPYSMQPFQMPGYEQDIWWGIATMYGTSGDPDVDAKQRSELAISNDGFNWHYLKPGFPFIDNGTDPNSDDYGCINAAIPVNNTKFSSDRKDLYYFYAASNKRHVSGRNPGVSLAFGVRGKWAGLHSDSDRKVFTSTKNDEILSSGLSATYSLYNGFYIGSNCCPFILSDVTEDPTGKNINNMNSYSAFFMYAQEGNTRGDLLLAVFGAPKSGTTTPSDDYEAVGFTYGGKDASSKYYLLRHLKKISEKDPTSIISMRQLPPFSVSLEYWGKNSNFYGIEFEITKPEAECPLSVENMSLHQPKNIWLFTQDTHGQYSTHDFSNEKLIPNETPPTCMVTGTLAIDATLADLEGEQVIVKVHGDKSNNNSMSISVTQLGDIVYKLTKDGETFAEMKVSPPEGQTFRRKRVSITVESLHPRNRKYGKEITDQVTLFRVSCPEMGFEKIVPQPIIWDWKHAEGAITESDRANAQCFAFLQFTSFVPSMTSVSIGCEDETGASRFHGTVHKTQFAPQLPVGKSDFWNE